MAEEDKKEESKDEKQAPDIRVQVVEEEPEEHHAKEHVDHTEHKLEEPIVEDTKEPEHPPTPLKTKESIPFWVLFISFLVGLTLGGGLVGGIFYFRNNVDNTPSQPKEMATPAPTTESPAPETSMEEDINLADYAVQVLNGTGKAGEAGTVADLLSSSGFETVDTGNSSKLGFTDTVIEAKEDVPQEVLDKIEASLVQYTLEFSTDSLEADSDYDIVVTVGSSRS